MPKYNFKWTTLPPSLLKELCTNLLRIEAANPAQALARAYGARRTVEFIRAACRSCETNAETPRLANAAERNVYQTLLEQLEPNDLVIPGQRVTFHLEDHEVDFVVAIEGAGIVCLEVKGGDVWHDGDTWWQRRRGHDHKIDPVRQAREAFYALREFVEEDERWTQGRLRDEWPPGWRASADAFSRLLGRELPLRPPK